eukprot:scaffold351_cov162-Ochromonas_danica.AAC.2
MFPKAWSKIPTTQSLQFDHVCFDMNQLLHTRPIKDLPSTGSDNHTAAAAANRQQKHDAISLMILYKTLDEFFKVIQPCKSVIFAFDGPAPFAKIQTQRIRRSDNNEHGYISPGTDFMNDIEDAIVCYIMQRLKRPSFQNITYFISGATLPGEGEIKIVRWINSHLSSPANRNESVVLCGLDADMILQAMSINVVSNVYVLQHQCNQRNMCNISRVLQDLTSNLDSQDNRIEQRKVVLDYVLLFLLNGCDYLPKLCGVSRRAILAAYRVALAELPLSTKSILDLDNESFHFSTLYEILRKLREDRHHLSWERLKSRYVSDKTLLTNLLQKKNVAMVWNDIPTNDVKEGWKAELFIVDNVTSATDDDLSESIETHIGTRVLAAFKTVQGYGNKKLAHRAISQVALRHLFPKHFAQQLASSQVENDRIVISDESVLSDVYFKDEWLDEGAEADSNSVLECADEEDDDEASDDEEDEDNRPDLEVSVDLSESSMEESVVQYLRGLLWVVNLFSTGECSDYGYSFQGNTPVQTYFRTKIHVPRSNSPAGARHVPEHLRDLWKWVNKEYFHNHHRRRHHYDTLVDCLHQYHKNQATQVQPSQKEQSVSTCNSDLSRAGKKKRSDTEKKPWRSEKQTLSANRLDLGVRSPVNLSVDLHSLEGDQSTPFDQSKREYKNVVSKDTHLWSVLAAKEHFYSKHYARSYKSHPLRLPLKLPFNSPSFLPHRYGYYRAVDHDSK